MTLESFPDACKIAMVKSIFKKDSKTDPSNYRPISLLRFLSNVFERDVLDQTKNFLSLNVILFDYQSGFRKNQSRDTSTDTSTVNSERQKFYKVLMMVN